MHEYLWIGYMQIKEICKNVFLIRYIRHFMHQSYPLIALRFSSYKPYYGAMIFDITAFGRMTLGKPLSQNYTWQKNTCRKTLGRKTLAERHLAERHLAERHLAERHLAERHLAEIHLAERHLEERHLDKDTWQ